ncbi:PREDICTED: protein chibby homolog 1 [Bactrocera latifrons]|uniref:protein chibby homolog 1 n=1 Tax=Bactrocera latifrons TaxID=174628 RepID=UPI0008DDB3B6|nr:PREDICTED: protein chibby homolog 1 [Bactrocera latifrons]
MPLFTKKYESKPIPPRSVRCNTGCPAISEDLDEFKSISLNLGSKELRFADGIWIHSTRKIDTDDVTRLNRRIKTLEEENNMCNLKMEIFLDLLAEQTSELNIFKSKNI